MDVLLLVHLFEIVTLLYEVQLMIGQFSFLVGATGLQLYLDLLLCCFLDPLFKLLQLVFLLDDELVNGVVLESQLPECIRHLLLFFISGFLNDVTL